MSRDQKSDGRSLRVQEIDGVLRHPDGSADIAAYANVAHRDRAAAIAASAREAIRMVRKMVSDVRARLVPIALPSGKHRARAGR